MKELVQEFKAFIMRGNVVDLAVAVIIGGAFGAVVKSLTDDVFMQIVAAIFGKPDFSSLTLGLGDAEIRYGSFLTVVINFLLIAAVLFMVLKAMTKAQALRKKAGEDEVDTPAPSDETVLLTEIRDLLKSGR